MSDEPTGWIQDFVKYLKANLHEKQAAGALQVDQVYADGVEVVTIFECPPRGGRRYGRKVDALQFRELFVPDRASAVAEAWFQSIYPPDKWTGDNLHQGVSWR